MKAILTYHSIDSTGSPVSVPPSAFRRQVEWLADGPLRVTDVETLLTLPREEDAVAVTFDDGLQNFRTEAWPLLRERGLPVTLFVVAGRAGTDNRWNGDPHPDIPEQELLGWDELALLAEEGVSLGSHGVSHCRLPGRAPDTVRTELAASRDMILERTGVRPAGFAYPYGDVDAFCRHVAAAHYDWACSTELKTLDGGQPRFALPRLDMYYFRRPGALEAWGTRRFGAYLSLRRGLRRLRGAVGGNGASGPAGPRRSPAAGGRDRGSPEVVWGATLAPPESVRPAPGDGGRPETPTPELSVIVPAHRAAEELHESLGALLESDLARERWELIVVNDGYDPETSAVARRYADTVVRLPGKPRGPSYARNRGAEVARGDILVFVDADVRVHHDTLQRFRRAFSDDPEVAAIFGSYDDRPPAGGVVSAYRNLLHHQVHQRNGGEAETFWAGCGAVRREVFEEVGGYDEWHFSRPQVEDIELGRRIRLKGHRILLRPEIQATHLKHWELGDVLLTDFKNRGIPWTRLVLHEGKGEGRRTLNLSPRHRWCVAMTGLAFAAGSAALLLASTPLLALAGLALATVFGLNLDFYALVLRRRGLVAACCTVPLHVLHYLTSGLSAVAGWLAYVTVGPPQPPADVAAFREVGMEGSPPLPAPPSESVWYRYDD